MEKGYIVILDNAGICFYSVRESELKKYENDKRVKLILSKEEFMRGLSYLI